METKPLLYGIIGFFLGGLIVSVAATYFPEPQQTPHYSCVVEANDKSPHVTAENTCTEES